MPYRVKTRVFERKDSDWIAIGFSSAKSGMRNGDVFESAMVFRKNVSGIKVLSILSRHRANPYLTPAPNEAASLMKNLHNVMGSPFGGELIETNRTTKSAREVRYHVRDVKLKYELFLVMKVARDD
uniref:Uncharacterized protein n=1 Tax=Vespula pensylvanica TaxID=30213 RepID=A0A834N4V5_VESPE|nr:hypothetical protein H0235_016422 [Vespula pensylvanica]